MARIKLLLSYDGRDFSGWQIQKNKRTVQGELQAGLSRLLGTEISIFGAGRTDSGVHATGQTAQFDLEEMRVPVEKLSLAIRGFLPADVKVHDAVVVDSDLHVCFSAVYRQYRYKFVQGVLYPHQRDYFGFFPYEIDLEYGANILGQLEGEHDFTSFCLKDCDAKTRIRNMHFIRLSETPEGFDIVFRANGFLRKMIRMLVGSFLMVYSFEDARQRFDNILTAKDNFYCGPPAAPGGLYLEEVGYDRQY